MPKNKNNNNSLEEEKDITINLKESSLAEFTKRPIPTQKQVENFERAIEESSEEPDDDFNSEESEEEITESLNEIYQDEDGHIVDVKKLDVRKRRGIIFWLVTLVIVFGGLASGSYFVYNYFYLKAGSDATAVEFKVEGKTEVVAGEEFFYTINYKNLSNIVITNARIEVSLPENFMYLDSYPEGNINGNSVWEIDSVPALSSNSIKIKGMMVGIEETTGIILANISYTPENFSSEFKKSASLTTVIKDMGLDLDFDLIATALVGEENEVKIRFKAKDNSYINNFRITFEPQENIEIVSKKIEIKGSEEVSEAPVSVLEPRPGVWDVTGVATEITEFPIYFKFLEKVSDQQEIRLHFERIGEDKSYKLFHIEKISFEVMKSDLNLALIINGSREDQGVNFGDKLNYTVVYNNKGETDMKDVVIMAVLESDFLDWSTLQDPLGGKEKGNTITWSKEEIPELEILAKHEEGTIDFSINMLAVSEINPGSNYEVKSYAQYSVGTIEGEEEKKSEDNLSNTIVNRINSDLKVKEALRYFSEDNIPVGTGPHPPKAGETTSYKVFWELKNNLHELYDLKMTVILPDYVNFNAKERATVGNVNYDEDSRTVTWDIGRLPITVFEAAAEFSIKVTPGEEDKNKIMVLLPGSRVLAVDSETEGPIDKSTKAKTSRLEDDEIAGGDGIVE